MLCYEYNILYESTLLLICFKYTQNQIEISYDLFMTELSWIMQNKTKRNMIAIRE